MKGLAKLEHIAVPHLLEDNVLVDVRECLRREEAPSGREVRRWVRVKQDRVPLVIAHKGETEVTVAQHLNQLRENQAGMLPGPLLDLPKGVATMPAMARKAKVVICIQLDANQNSHWPKGKDSVVFESSASGCERNTELCILSLKFSDAKALMLDHRLGVNHSGYLQKPACLPADGFLVLCFGFAEFKESVKAILLGWSHVPWGRRPKSGQRHGRMRNSTGGPVLSAFEFEDMYGFLDIFKDIQGYSTIFKGI